MTRMLQLEAGERILHIQELGSVNTSQYEELRPQGWFQKLIWAVLACPDPIRRPVNQQQNLYYSGMYYMAFSTFGRTFKYNTMTNTWSAQSEI